MSPKRLTTKATQPGEGRGRRQVAEKYLEVANLIDSEDGTALNVCVGVAVLAGIAAGDAVARPRSANVTQGRTTRRQLTCSVEWTRSSASNSVIS